jgi:hypothetical protein
VAARCRSPSRRGYARTFAGLVASPTADDKISESEVEALKRRISELLVECRANPYIGELMGSGRHPELADCRRVRFDVPSYKAGRASGPSTAMTHPTGRLPNAAGSPAHPAPGYAHTARRHSARAEGPDRISPAAAGRSCRRSTLTSTARAGASRSDEARSGAWWTDGAVHERLPAVQVRAGR